MEARATVSIDATGSTQGAAQIAEASGRILEADKKVKTQLSKPADLGHHEHILSSNHRVARSIQNVTSQLAAGGGAAGIFAAGLEGLERSLHLSIGALAGFGVAAIAIDKVAESMQRVKDLGREMDKVVTQAGHDVSGGTQPEFDKQFESAEEIFSKTMEETRPSKTTTKLSNIFRKVGTGILTGGIEEESMVDSDSNLPSEQDREEQRQKAKQVEKDALTATTKLRYQRGDIENTRWEQGEIASERVAAQYKLQNRLDEDKQKYSNKRTKGTPELEALYASDRANGKIDTDAIDRKEAREKLTLEYEQKAGELGRENDSDKRAALELQVNYAEKLSDLDMTDLKAKGEIAKAERALAEFDDRKAFNDKQALDAGAARLESLDDEIAGNERLAKLVEMRAKFAAQIAQENHAGHYERAEQLGAEQAKTEAMQRFDDYGTMTGAQVHRRMTTERKAREKRKRQLERFARNEGLIDTHRDSEGNIDSGIDPMTGERVWGRHHGGMSALDRAFSASGESTAGGSMLDGHDLSLSAANASGSMLDMGAITGGVSIRDLKDTMDKILSVFQK